MDGPTAIGNTGEAGRGGLFAHCNIVVIKSDADDQHGGLDEEQGQKLIQTLKLHDAEARMHRYYNDNDDGNDDGNSDNNLSLEGVTHVISSTFDFPDYERAADMLIAVVKPGWVEGSLVKNKLANTRQYSPDPRLFMTDVVACCADLPDGDADAIAGGIVAMGGMYVTKLTSQVTHIVALTIEAPQCEYAIKTQLRARIVLPHWFDDCLKLGRKIDEQPYLLPDPDILKPQRQSKNNSNNRIPLSAAAAQRGNQLTGAVHPDPGGDLPPFTASETRRKQNVFKNKSVMLSSDLGIGPRLRGYLEDLIKGGGGRVSKSVEECDMYICKYRDGQGYKSASCAGKQVGNLAWLYYLITTDRWTSPLRRLLHYPIVKGGVPGFKGFKISLSNYTGEARTYLESLITVSGAEYTKTLKQENTHLITAHTMSEKCEAARDWGVEIINHLWLEESYAQWKVQSLSNSRYTHFPQRTNLGEVVGQTPIDREVLEQKFFPTDPNKDKIVVLVDNAATRASTTVTPKTTDSNRKTEAPKTTDSTKKKEAPKTPKATRLVATATGKENITPSEGTGRKSKEAAAAKLQELTSDIALYERERKRAGGVVYGGRRKLEQVGTATGTSPAAASRKRSIHEASETEAFSGAESEEVTGKAAKKIKKTEKTEQAPPEIKMRLLISGYTKWLNHHRVEDADRTKLRNLGIQVTMDPSKATHLAAPHVLRTLKFVTAMAYGPVVVSTEFIDACLEQEKLLNANDFLLKDKESEKKFGFTLKESRKRAGENKQQLLRNRAIYCMEKVHGGVEAFESIIKANGGQCMRWRNRKGTMVPSRRASSEEGETRMGDGVLSNEVLLLSGSGDGEHDATSNEKRLWERFEQMVEHSRKTPRIVSTDWLIQSALCQKLMPTEQFLIER